MSQFIQSQFTVCNILPRNASLAFLPLNFPADVTVPLAVVKFNVCQTAIVSEIENPWSFYIQVHEPAYNQLMEELWYVVRCNCIVHPVGL